MMRAVLWLTLLVFAVGCGGYPTPFTARDMAQAGTGEALVHYLSQPGATATACDRSAKGPRFSSRDPDELAALSAGLEDGRIPPGLWQRCAMLLLKSASPDVTTAMLDAMAASYERLLSDGAVEDDADFRARLEALHRTILLRPRATAPDPIAVEPRFERLVDALARDALGPKARALAEELVAAVELERGLLDGKPLTEDKLDALAKEGDAKTLRRIVARIRDDELRQAARRRIVRMHIAASSYAVVRKAAAEVEERVLALGRNPIDLNLHHVSSAWIDQAQTRVGGVLVRQDLRKQAVTLLAFDAQDDAVRVLPSVKLRGAVFARVDELEKPITLCAEPEVLDVAPCLLPADLKPAVPIVYLDDQGLLHFVERLAMADAQRLVFDTSELPLTFAVGGRDVLTIEWPIRFEVPKPIVATSAGGQGADLKVSIARRYAPRLLFEIVQGDERMSGVVEERDLDRFLIASRGATGTAGAMGTAGSNGMSGSSGMSATCPSSSGQSGGNGSPGGNGGPGGPGGPGGDGGNIEVSLSCVTGDCGRIAKLVESFVVTQGGPGGSGGQGGPGGSGGSGGPGGSGTSCYDSTSGQSSFLSGGSAGMSGSDGSPGARGPDGSAGSPGGRVIHIVP
jgi:hypothetical protein